MVFEYRVILFQVFPSKLEHQGKNKPERGKNRNMYMYEIKKGNKLNIMHCT